MIARAPGKVVISGAYSVLEGAPAIVAAVDRYVVADAARRAMTVTPEVEAALDVESAPHVDASALRARGIKLGLGSSAAILVASLAAVELRSRGPLSDDRLGELVFEPARRAHADAQGGGSGIDVAASTFGGVLLVRRLGERLMLDGSRLPPDLWFEIWFCGRAASTRELLASIADLRRRDPRGYTRAMGAQAVAAERAAQACTQGQAAELLDALAEQSRCLEQLGLAAGAPIVSGEMRQLSREARDQGSVVLPSGAGGGDVVLCAGTRPPAPRLSARAVALGFRPLELRLGARGVHAAG